MPNLEVKCSKDMEHFFLENNGELLRKMHALLQGHQSLDPVTEEPKNTMLRNRVATTLTPWTFCIVGDEEGPSKRVSVNFALGDKPDRKGPLGDRLRKDLGLDLEDVIVNHLSGKYKMEEGREYTMVSETREVNRHHYNDKPRKKAPARSKNLEPNPQPDKPAFEMPPGAINTHCHVNSNGMTPFPWSDDRKYDPAFAPWRKLLELDTFLGFAGEVIVAATCHGTDNSYMLNALKKSKGRALGVAFVDKNISDQELVELDKAGVRGVRYSYVKRLTNPPPPEEMIAMANRVKHLNWHIDLYCEAADLKDLEPHIKAIPIPVVFDHMAVPAIDNGVERSRVPALSAALSRQAGLLRQSDLPRASHRIEQAGGLEQGSSVRVRAGRRIPQPRDHRHRLASSQHERGTDAQRRRTAQSLDLGGRGQKQR